MSQELPCHGWAMIAPFEGEKARPVGGGGEAFAVGGSACSVGGTVKEGRIEIQGNKREEVKRILIEAGFKPVFAGG